VWEIYTGGTGTTGSNLIALEAPVTMPVLGDLYAVAGNSSTSGYVGNGVLATVSGVEFHGINDMKFDAAGNLYIVDVGLPAAKARFGNSPSVPSASAAVAICMKVRLVC
jgi:hypothetical protein